MTTLLKQILPTPFRGRLVNCIWKTQKAGVAKKAGIAAVGKGKGAAPASKKKELVVEEDTKILCSRLCGGNIYKEGEDPVLKDDSEYPDWLWTLRLERDPIPLEEYTEDDPKYWKILKKMNMRRNQQLQKHRKLR